MNRSFLHPRIQIAEIMDRIYRYGMTTTSGGNLSILDDDGSIWISPGGTDKGVMEARDVVRMRGEERLEGGERPSVEYPFHRAVYAKRPDIRAVLHAHPPALVAFSVAGKTPDTRVIPQVWSVCGKVGFAPYALPGSEQLGRNIAAQFEAGCDIVVMENHGVVASGSSLLDAFQRFETLEFCARTIINASTLGGAIPLKEEQLGLFPKYRTVAALEETVRCIPGSRELEIRDSASRFVRRAYERRLMTSTEGILSARLDDTDFVITPFGMDRKNLGSDDLVAIRGGKREAGSRPSQASALHRKLYLDHPGLGSIISAQCPNVTAFIVSKLALDSRTIPESYANLRDVPIVPFHYQFLDHDRVSAALSARNPVLVLDGDCVLASGKTILEAYDRLEVAEATANALIAAQRLGGFKPIDQGAIDELVRAFNIPG